MARLTVEITTGNAAMLDQADVSMALSELALRVLDRALDIAWKFPVRDADGATVGYAKLDTASRRDGD